MLKILLQLVILGTDNPLKNLITFSNSCLENPLKTLIHLVIAVILDKYS